MYVDICFHKFLMYSYILSVEVAKKFVGGDDDEKSCSLDLILILGFNAIVTCLLSSYKAQRNTKKKGIQQIPSKS